MGNDIVSRRISGGIGHKPMLAKIGAYITRFYQHRIMIAGNKSIKRITTIVKRIYLPCFALVGRITARAKNS